ncbi:MAG: galactokinase [Lentisphaeraceae bacterium]|nr:galactokinase [Lentisphaeraceae bacterium]
MSKSNTDLFAEYFGCQPELLAQAPGRLEVLGNHTDYNEGFVLSTAVNCKTEFSFRAIEGRICKVCSPFMGDGIRQFDLDNLDSELPAKDWTKYIRGVVAEFQALGHQIGAFETLITSDVPHSAGMSSSAALEMACVSGLCELFDIELTLFQKARVGQLCEHNTIGAKTGLMDQLTSLAGKDGHLVVSEYRDIIIEHSPLPQNYLFVVVDSGVTHDLSCEYNERREQCENALAELQKHYENATALRDIDLPMLAAHKCDLEDVDYRRALHVVGENTRVLQACGLLIQGKLAEFGQLLFDSHDSSINNFENSCEELDVIIDLARKSDLCIGARLSGGGFGGVSIHLVQKNDAKAYSDYITETLKDARILVCHSAAGASVEKFMLTEVK